MEHMLIDQKEMFLDWEAAAVDSKYNVNILGNALAQQTGDANNLTLCLIPWRSWQNLDLLWIQSAMPLYILVK